MNMWKRILSSITIVLLLVTVGISIVGCPPAAPPAVEETTPEVEVTPTEKVKIGFWTKETDPPSVEVYKEIIEDFEAQYPNIDVELVLITEDEMEAKVNTTIAAGGLMDVLNAEMSQQIALAQEGKWLSLDDVVDKLGGRDQYIYEDLIIFEDHVYAIPYAGGGPVIYFRKDLVEEAGLPIPPEDWTWDDLLDYAEKLTKEDIYGISIPAGRNAATTFFVTIFMWSAGTDVFDADLNVNIADNPRAVETLKFYTDLLKYAPEGVGDFSWFETIDAFTGGRTAMCMYWGRVMGRIYEEAPDLIGKVGAQSMPKNRMQVTMYDPNWYSIYAETEYPEECKLFVEFLCIPENAVKFQLTVPGHLTPVTKTQIELMKKAEEPIIADNPDIMEILFESKIDKYNNALYAGGIDEVNLKVVHTPKLNPYWALETANNFLSIAVQRVIFEGASPEEAIQEAADALNKLVEMEKAK